MSNLPFPHGGLINIPSVPYIYSDEEKKAMEDAEFNREIIDQLDANDKHIIRALVDGDDERLAEHRAKQSTLRAQLRS